MGKSHCSYEPAQFVLKCRVNTEKVTVDAFQERFGNLVPFTLRFPLPSKVRDVSDAFLVFQSEADRRQLHRLNETYVEGWQIRLLLCSDWAWKDAQATGEYKEVMVQPKSSSDEVEHLQELDYVQTTS